MKKDVFPFFDCCGVGASIFELQGLNSVSRIIIHARYELVVFILRQRFVDSTRVVSRVHQLLADVLPQVY